jgi:hypothetical protein
MDHDRLKIGRDRLFLPQDLLRGMWEDQRYILGDGVGQGSSGKGEAGFLEEIYRIRSKAATAGREVLRAAARRSYRKARAAMATDPEVRPCFRRSFLRESGDWEAVMKRLPSAWRKAPAGEGWKEDLRGFLVGLKYEPSRIEPYLDSMSRCSGFLANQLFFHQAR